MTQTETSALQALSDEEAAGMALLASDSPTGVMMTGEPVAGATLHDYGCPACGRILLKSIDPGTHPFRLHRVALQCVCGQLSAPPEVLRDKRAKESDPPRMLRVTADENGVRA
jgi:hypothetical protein